MTDKEWQEIADAAVAPHPTIRVQVMSENDSQTLAARAEKALTELSQDDTVTGITVVFTSREGKHYVWISYQDWAQPEMVTLDAKDYKIVDAGEREHISAAGAEEDSK